MQQASVGHDARNQRKQWRIDFVLPPLGRSHLGVLTQKHMQEQMAIVLDGRILSAPVVQSPITGGRGTIDGDFTKAEAKRIAAILTSGPLPAPIRLVPTAATGK